MAFRVSGLKEIRINKERIAQKAMLSPSKPPNRKSYKLRQLHMASKAEWDEQWRRDSFLA